jgi:hypothetical protein
VIVNVAVVDPAGTVTVAGTVATDVLLDESDTTAPLPVAAWASVIVPVDDVPPMTDVGLAARVTALPALTVIAAVTV